MFNPLEGCFSYMLRDSLSSNIPWMIHPVSEQIFNLPSHQSYPKHPPLNFHPNDLLIQVLSNPLWISAAYWKSINLWLIALWWMNISQKVNLKYERTRDFECFLTLYYFSSLKLDHRLTYCTLFYREYCKLYNFCLNFFHEESIPSRYRPKICLGVVHPNRGWDAGCIPGQYFIWRSPGHVYKISASYLNFAELDQNRLLIASTILTI